MPAHPASPKGTARTAAAAPNLTKTAPHTEVLRSRLTAANTPIPARSRDRVGIPYQVSAQAALVAAMSARLALAAVGGPYDLAGAVCRVDQDGCFCRQCPRRGSTPGGQVIADGAGWIGAGRDWQRAAEKVDTPACIPWRITGVPAELRRAEVSRSAPPGREGPVVMLGVEGPDIEVLDAVLPVDVVQGSTLAQRPAQQAAGIATGTARMAAEQLGLSLSGQCSEAQKVGYLDAGRRPIQILGHSAIFPPTQQDRRDAQPSDMRHERAF